MHGELTKLKIESFKKNDFKERIGDYETLLNPENFSLKHVIQRNEIQPDGSSGAQSQFTRILPNELKISFLFDATGVVRKNAITDQTVNPNGIIEDVEKFRKAVYYFDGENHEPPYLKIFWGALLFKGVLSELDINFKLFKPDGTPIRAVAEAKFIGSIEEDLRRAMEGKTSPDMTHVRMVKAGDTLPLMTHKIYGDSKYYLEVARANGLLNFRKLKVGQSVFFPPLAKK